MEMEESESITDDRGGKHIFFEAQTLVQYEYIA
jgi:hypothetical protein